jgi:hypothetical protein
MSDSGSGFGSRRHPRQDRRVQDRLVATFSPDDITGLVGWYKSDVGFVAGTSWADQSGTGNNLTVTGAIAGANLNGRPTVSFDGVNDIADCNPFDLGAAGAVSICAVCKQGGPIVAEQVVASYGDGAFDIHGFGANSGSIARVANAIGGADGSVNIQSAWRRCVTIQTDDPSTDVLYVDNVSDATQAGVGNVADGLILAVGHIAGSTKYFNGLIAEVLVYNVALTAGNRSSIHSYLGTAWDL